MAPPQQPPAATPVNHFAPGTPLGAYVPAHQVNADAEQRAVGCFVMGLLGPQRGGGSAGAGGGWVAWSVGKAQPQQQNDEAPPPSAAPLAARVATPVVVPAATPEPVEYMNVKMPDGSTQLMMVQRS